MIIEAIEKFLDKHFFGTGTRSMRPESEVADAIRNGALILDVRTGLEAKQGMVPGAKNIDMLVLGRHLDDLPRDRTIVTYCKSGGRAGKARDILVVHDFTAINGGPYERVLKIVQDSQASAE